MATQPQNMQTERTPIDNWEPFANCLGVDPELFFPQRGEPTEAAKAVCQLCIVRQECLETALENGEKFGIWGGLSERERRQIRKQRHHASKSIV
jgi:WhiB family redox-sensing transcriptional regulator